MAVSLANISVEECDQEVCKKGKCVLLIWALAGEKIDWWVRAVAKRSGQRVDWHWYGGRARVMALGDTEKVRDAIDELIPELQKISRATLSKHRMLPTARLYMKV